jgi:hypothetical protein
VRRALLGWMDRAALGLRALAWSIARRGDPNRPSTRYDRDLPLSFAAFDKLRFAPAVVFRGRKAE